MAGLGSFNPAAAVKNLEKTSQKTGRPLGPKPAPARNIGPLKGGIGSLPMPKAPATKPAPRMFSQGLAAATQKNYRTGGYLEAYGAQHPKPAHQGLLQKALGLVGQGEHAVTGLAAKLEGNRPTAGSALLGGNPVATPAEREGEARKAAGLALAIAPGTGFMKGGAALKGVADTLEAARAGKLAGGAGKLAQSGLADREALREVAGNAIKGVPQEALQNAPSTAAKLGDLRATLEATGARSPTLTSRALKLGGTATAGYGKMLVAAPAAQAALPGGPPNKNESFPEKFWNSAIHTVASLPAGVIETVKHPVKTAEGMAKMYGNPEQAWNENPAGTLMAFLAPAAGLERGAGGLVRTASKGRLLSMERPDLQYMSGQALARRYQPGLVSQLAQRTPDVVMKKVGKGEQPVTAPLKPGEPTPPRDVRQATKMQERRDVLGSRLGGLVRPGMVDLVRGGERLGRNLETMKGRAFLNEHLPHDEIHATAFMALHEGVAKTAKTFWSDVADRVAHLKDEQRGLTGTDRAYNAAQIESLVNMEQHRSQLSTGDLEHYEKGAGEVAARQREMWSERNQEGVGEPNQLNARDLPPLLMHGHLMDRGTLTHVAEPGDHEYVGQLKQARQEVKAQQKIVAKANADLAVAKARTAGVKSAAQPGTKASLKVGKHWQERVDEARAGHNAALEKVQQLGAKLSVAEHAGAVRPGGKLFPGVYDETGLRVTPAETEKFIQEHFGREIGFVTHKQDLAAARSQNSYGPRTVFPMRTGGNFMAGAYDNSPEALRNHFDVHAHNMATMRGRRSVAENLTLLGHDGKPMTEADAKRAADNMNRTEGGGLVKQHLGEMVPYNLGAEKVTQLIEGHPYTKALEQQGLVEHKALMEEGDKAATWGIMPKQVADRLNKWDQVETHLQSSFLRQLTTPWRQTNLYTSVRWPFGTTQENAIRLAFHQVSPLVTMPYGKYTSLSFGTGSHIVRMLDDKINDPSVPHAQKQAAIWHRAQFGTGSFAGAQIHELDPALHQLAKDSFWSKIAENPLNRGVVHTNQRHGPIGPGDHLGWRPYRQAVGNILNKMETNSKIAAGGKLALNDAKFFNKYRAIDREQAARDYVEKITTDPAESIKAAQNLMEIMGNWNHLTPYTRVAQAELAPFALWWLNSAKFVFKTLPRDHPYATGLLAAMVTATGVENRNLKPYLTGTVPLTLPLLGTINLNPVHYSPFDIANEPYPKAASMVAPQLSEAVFTAKGVDPLTGEKFAGGGKEGEGTEATEVGRGGVSFLENMVPGVRLASQLLGGGGVPTKTSVFPWERTKQLGFVKAAAKSFFPAPFTYVRGKAKPKEGAGNLGPGGRIPESRVSESRVPETRLP